MVKIIREITAIGLSFRSNRETVLLSEGSTLRMANFM